MILEVSITEMQNSVIKTDLILRLINDFLCKNVPTK